MARLHATYKDFAEILESLPLTREHIVLEHKGKDVAAIIPLEDLQLFKYLLQEVKLEREHVDIINSQLTTIVESADDAIIGKTLDGIIFCWNASAEKIYGYAAEEVKGCHISLLVPPDRPDEVPQLLKRIAREEHIDHYETIRVRKDGKRIKVSLTISPIINSTGKIIGVSTLARDITEQILVETKLARLLASEQQARKQVEVAKHVKDEFLTNLSQEICTPLNAIIDFTGTFGSLTNDQVNPFQIIQTNAKHLLSLISGLLDFIKAEASEINLFYETFYIKQLINEVMDEVQSVVKTLTKKNIVFKTSFSPDVGLITLDKEKFKRVLHHLVSNSANLTDEDGNVAIITELIEKDRLRIQVRYTDIGICKKDTERLYTEFQQLDSSSTKFYQGMDLPLIKKIVELHQGTIGFESEVGRGITFTVVLPVANKEVSPSYNGK